MEILVKILSISGKYAIEMILIFPAVLILMGLADIWVPKNLVKKHLGETSGVKGIAIAIVLGTLTTGPMYIAFPIASEMLNKGASISNIIIFLGVWASLKIPQIGVEVQFLGLKFSFLRFVFTIISIIVTGVITEYMCKGGKNYEKRNSPEEI